MQYDCFEELHVKYNYVYSSLTLNIAKLMIVLN